MRITKLVQSNLGACDELFFGCFEVFVFQRFVSFGVDAAFFRWLPAASHLLIVFLAWIQTRTELRVRNILGTAAERLASFAFRPLFWLPEARLASFAFRRLIWLPERRVADCLSSFR